MARTSTYAEKEKKELNLNLIPQNIEAEEAVLGAILVNPTVITKIVEFITPECFYKPAHRYVYEAMLQLFNQNDRIDIVSVSDVLSFNSKLEIIGGRAFINDLSFKTITTANIEYYAKIVQEKAIKRALINAGSEIVTLGYDLNPTEQSLDTAETLIFDIASKKATKDMSHVKDLVLDSYERLEERYKNRDKITGVPTDFYDLDTLTNGLQNSDLIVLAARPSMGKTAFALNIAQNVAIKAKIPVAIFSLEMSKEQLMQRMLCSEGEIDTQKLKTGNIAQKEWNMLASVMDRFMHAPLYIDDTPGCTLTDLRAKCRRFVMEEKNLGLIIIDYLQLMEGSGKEERIQQISAISRGLKALARELNVPIIALSQLSRAVEQRKDRHPMLSDLRESGAIEQDADIVMFIYRDEYYETYQNKGDNDNEGPSINPQKKGKADIIIAKHRNGPTGTIELLFDSSITKFKNPIKTDIF